MKLELGNVDAYLYGLHLWQPSKFHRYLAMGVEQVSSKYGGKEFAWLLVGMRCPDTIRAGYLIGLRHSHLVGQDSAWIRKLGTTHLRKLLTSDS